MAHKKWNWEIGSIISGKISIFFRDSVSENVNILKRWSCGLIIIVEV